MPPGRIPPVANSPDKIQLERLSHVCYGHTDLDKFDAFAQDFGLEQACRTESAIYYRGWGKDACAYAALQAGVNGQEEGFTGAAFIAGSEQDFTRCASFPGASEVESNPAPGGGKRVKLASPSGSIIYIIWGQEDRTASVEPVSSTDVHKGPYNTTLAKPRKGEFQRFKIGPAMVHKIGHYGYLTRMFDEDIAFYTENFNFVPSDILYEEVEGQGEVDSLTFMHLDRGQTYVDHHTLFLSRVPDSYPKPYQIHHSSFEVEDFDTQMLGHEHLLNKGYSLVWGVGRHILGSQIFDYWKDPSGLTIEHYADGDVVNVDNPTGRMKSEGAASMYIWGPIRPANGVAG